MAQVHLGVDLEWHAYQNFSLGAVGGRRARGRVSWMPLKFGTSLISSSTVVGQGNIWPGSHRHLRKGGYSREGAFGIPSASKSNSD